MRKVLKVIGGLLLASGASLAQAAEVDSGNTLRLYNWTDYIGETTLADFEKATGIKVIYDTFDGYETVQTKLLTGRSGYDLVMLNASLVPPLISAGVFQALDKQQLPSWQNLDQQVVNNLQGYDPGLKYSAPYTWGSSGVTYNVDKITARMPDAPIGSLAMLFDPKIVSRFADCGVTLMDAPTEVIPLALQYLGKDPRSASPADLKAAEQLLLGIRPYIRKFDSVNYLTSLPNGDVCLALTWSGDYATAQARAVEAKKDIKLSFFIPQEGSLIWFDNLYIPKDAPHAANAHRFIEFLLQPQTMAKVTDYIHYANSNAAATALVRDDIRQARAIRWGGRVGLCREAPVPEPGLGFPAITVNDQHAAGWKAADSRMDGPWLDRRPVRQCLHQSQRIEGGCVWECRVQRLDLRGEPYVPRIAGVEERADPRPVAGEHQPPPHSVPERDRELPIQEIDEPVPVPVIQVNDHLGVGPGMETVAQRLEGVAQLDVVEDFPVEHRPRGLALVVDRLRPSLQVDDGEARMRQRDPRFGVEPVPVRPAMGQRMDHALQDRIRRVWHHPGSAEPRNSAHRWPALDSRKTLGLTYALARSGHGKPGREWAALVGLGQRPVVNSTRHGHVHLRLRPGWHLRVCAERRHRWRAAPARPVRGDGAVVRGRDIRRHGARRIDRRPSACRLGRLALSGRVLRGGCHHLLSPWGYRSPAQSGAHVRCRGPGALLHPARGPRRRPC
mgnify:CR=1 FL=1